MSKWRVFIRFLRDILSVKHPPENVSDHKSFPKLKKSVLLLSFNGQGYKGMQRNPNLITVEGKLFEALTKAGAIPPNPDPKKLNYQRCSRTDKGVSAARLVVSLKMVHDPSLLPSINDHLPPQIRVFSMKRVTKSFHSRYYCSEREYEYLMPAYAFATRQQPLSVMLQYRIDDATLEQVNTLLENYIGVHNFHNFTRKRSYNDRGSKRYIKSFEVCKSFLAKSNCRTCGESKEMEFLVLRVRGSGFMLHQIRKMIGLVVAIIRGHATEETITNAFDEHKVHISRAPSLGLLLDNVRFDGYNRRFGTDGSRERLEWDNHKEEIEEFKREHIYQTIIDTEVNDMSMMEWLCGPLKLHALSQPVFNDSAKTTINSFISTEVERQSVK